MADVQRRQGVPVKVYCGSHLRNRVAVAASSWAEVSSITGQSVYSLTRYWSITGNAEDIAAAMERPGEIVVLPNTIHRHGSKDEPALEGIQNPHGKVENDG